MARQYAKTYQDVLPAAIEIAKMFWLPVAH
jgi:hypothetical protein